MARAVPRAREALRAYGLDRKGEKPGLVLTRAMTDLMFRWMTRRTAELHQGRAFVYEFDWRSPALGGELGAAHAVELPFVFDTLACASGERGLLGVAPPQALADSIHRALDRLRHHGSAPWPQYEARRPAGLLDDPRRRRAGAGHAGRAPSCPDRRAARIGA